MDTSIPIPAVLEDAITQGAKRLGKALEKLERPNAGSDAPCHEINAIFNVAYFLNSASFLTYLEATTVNRGRVDLIGFNDDIAFALEAKGWGRLNSQADGIYKDLERLQNFRPLLSEVGGKHQVVDWWAKARQRWIVLLITSFRGAEVGKAWENGDEVQMRSLMSSYTNASDRVQEAEGKASGFLRLWRAIPHAYRRAAPITDGTQWDIGDGPSPGALLWAALPLPFILP